VDGANTLAKTVVQVVEPEGALLVTRHVAFGDIFLGFSGISSANGQKKVNKGKLVEDTKQN